MVRYKQTNEILKLISDRSRVRNIGIIAHVDHGKCVAGDTVVFLGDGRLIRIKDLFRDSVGEGYGAFVFDVELPSFDPESKSINLVRASHIWRLKKDRIIRVRLRNGYEVKVTPEHPFYTVDGSGILKPIRADELRPGHYIVVPSIVRIRGRGLDWFKKYVMDWLLKQDDMYIYLDEPLKSIIERMIRSRMVKRVYEAGVGTSYKMLLESVKHGRYRCVDIRRLVNLFGLDLIELYDSIKFVGYKGNRGRYGGRVSKFSLPKTAEELKSALYVVGLLFGDRSSNCSLNSLDDELIDLYECNLWNAFKIGITVVVGRTTKNVLHRGGKAFEKFMYGVFKYPRRSKAKSLVLPDVISSLDNGYVRFFLRGLFDTGGTVEWSPSAVSLVSASNEFLVEVAYLLQRFGILPIVRRSRAYRILYISGKDISKFAEHIGFYNSVKRARLEALLSKACSSRVGQYVPIEGNELKTLRLAIGLSVSELSIPYYSYYEDGREKLTLSTFRKIVERLSEGFDIKRLKYKYDVLNKALAGEVDEFNNRDRGVVRSLVRDGVLKPVNDKYLLTNFGNAIKDVWKRVINGSDSVDESIKIVLSQWRSLAFGDIRIVEVVGIDVIKGDFDVYDLTVPGTHTFVANGVIVHNTTLTDSLLAASGLLSPTVAGEARALDYLEEEQKRGITIKTANISLLHDYNGENYVINLIDTPGHVDFTGKVTRALRAIDGAVVVVDAVEEVMVQTETVTRQALEERVKPILFINKVDRLITELRMEPKDIQKKLIRIITRFNKLIDVFAENEYKDKWKVRPDLNNVAFGSAKDRWGFTLKQAQSKGMTFNDVIQMYADNKIDELRKIFPVHEAVLDMVIEHIPSPLEAQKYRIPKIWRGDLNSEVGQAMLNCDPDGPVAFMVTNVIVDEKAGLVATGRLLSGSLEPGMEVYLINKARKGRILQVGMYMGPYREVVSKMIAGNIPAVLGLSDVTAGETVSTLEDMVPFEAIRYISEPVVTVSIEPKNTRDLPKLVNALRKMAIEDPNLHVSINEETGEYLLSGMGTLHLEVSLHFLRDMGIEVTVSNPIVVYRETITKQSPIFPGKSPNKHNKVKVRLEKLDDEVIELITSGKLNERLGRREIQKILMEKGWSADEARSVWAIDNEYGNIMVDLTRGVQYLQESKQMLIGAFFDFIKEGALAREPLRGVKVVLLDALFHEDPAHRTLAQVVPMLHRALLGAELASEPTLYEPIMKIQVQVPSELIGAVTSVIASKRGQVTSIDQREYYSVVNGYIPVAETFDLAPVLRSATGGRAFWQTQFSHWQVLPKSLLNSVVSEIRRRKGLPPEPPSYTEFIPPGEQVEY